MNYLEIQEKELQCRLRHREVQRLTRRINLIFQWAILDIEYMGG